MLNELHTLITSERAAAEADAALRARLAEGFAPAPSQRRPFRRVDTTNAG
jgi:hypothetical protein